MFQPTREQVRALFFEAWRKYAARAPLEGAEAIALEVSLLHPEYHAVLERPGRFAERDYSPESGETNPFLHLSLHLALEEQLSIDQPRGIAPAFATLLGRSDDRHAALHDAMECLAEMIWKSQRHSVPPDGAAYVECVRARSRV